MHSQKVLIDYVLSFDPEDHYAYFIPGFYAAKVNLQWVYPLYTCGEGVAKGHYFCQRLRF